MGLVGVFVAGCGEWDAMGLWGVEKQKYTGCLIILLLHLRYSINHILQRIPGLLYDTLPGVSEIDPTIPSMRFSGYSGQPRIWTLKVSVA